MKKVFSLLLAAVMITTLVFCPTAGVLASAEAATTSTQEWSITNTYDDGYTYTDINFTTLSTLSGGIADDVGADGGKAFKYNRIYSEDFCATNPYINIYDNTSADFVTFIPSPNTTYKISIKYKSTKSFNSADNIIELHGVKKADLSDSVLLGEVAFITRKTTVSDWTTAELIFTIGNVNFNSLALVLNSTATGTSATACNIYLDDITLTKTEQKAVSNTYDESGYAYTDINYTSLTTVTGAVSAETGVDSSAAFKFNRIYNSDFNATNPYINIYDNNTTNYGKFSPAANTTYKLSLKYKSTKAFNYADNTIELWGIKHPKLSDGVLLGEVAYIERKTTVDDWTTTELIFNVGDESYNSLAIVLTSTVGGTSAQACNIYIDDISVTIVNSKPVSNTYDETGYTYTDIKYDTGSANPIGVITEDGVSGNAYKFNRIYNDTYSSPNPYINIYDNSSSVFAKFAPTVNTTYRLTLKYKSTKAFTYADNTLELRGVLDPKLSDSVLLGEVFTVWKTTTVDDWTTAETIFTIGSTGYNSLALVLSSTVGGESAQACNIYIDDIVITKLTDSPIVNTYDDGYVYSDIKYDTSENPIGQLENGMSGQSFRFNRIYNETYCAVDPYINIYDNNSESIGSFVPKANTTYKISLKYKSTIAFGYSEQIVELRGVNSADLSDSVLFGEIFTVERAQKVEDWTTAELYFTVDDGDYSSLALVLNSTVSSSGAHQCNIQIDNIVVEEYGSGTINKVIGLGSNTAGFAAVKDGKWLTVNANDTVKVSYRIKSDVDSENIRISAQVLDADAYEADIRQAKALTLFTAENTSGGYTYYNTTFTANTAGNVIISVYTDDSTAVETDISIEDFAIDTYTQSILKGDTNLDGALNLKDLVKTKKAIAMNYRLGGDYLVNSDLDKTGTVAAGDLVVIRQLLLNTYDNTDTLAIDLAYDFANETAGSAEGTITLTSKETVDNYIELYWGADGKPIADYYYIGSAAISAGSTAKITMDARLAIPDGATQIILSDGLDLAVYDIPESKVADGSFSPYSISLVKDYTVGENIANVAVVYPSNSTSDTYNIACEFRNELTDILGADVEFIADTEVLDSNSYYILLGKTSVKESVKALNEIVTDRADYNGDYIIRETNKKIVITADNDYALELAIEDFFSNYCVSEDSLIEAGMDYKSSQYNELGTITLAGTDIAEYTVVYPETASILEVDAADYLVSNVLKKTGKLLDVTNDTTEVGAYEILIGNTNRTNAEYATTAAGNVDNSYAISVGTNATSIESASNSAVNVGVIDFTSRILSGSLSEGTYTGSYDGSYSLTNGYKLAWSDEFSGTELSDTWSFCDTDGYDTVTGGKTEFLMENATVSGGTLKATAYMDGVDSKGLGIYTRGTNSKYFKYGYFEARMKLSDIQGFTSAFWMTTIGKQMNGLTCYGEFDILEMYTTNNTVHPNLHNHSTAENHKNYLQGTGAPKPSVSTTDPLGEKFHNFGMEWTDDYIYFYLDGVRYYSFDCTLLPEYDVFDQIASINMTFNAGLYVEPTVDSSVAYVDWIRVWQKDEAGYTIK